MMKHNHRQGFTLLELLIVVAIVSVLISISLPALRAARETAWLVMCNNNLRQIMTTGFAYSNDFGDAWVLAAEEPDERKNSTNALWLSSSQDEYVLYGRLLVHYLGTESNVFYCPGSEFFQMDSENYGSANAGRHGKNAIGSYLQRGAPEGGPLFASEMASTAAIGDLYGFRGTPDNHRNTVNAVYMDTSAETLKVSYDWSILDERGHGGDSSPGAGDGAWTQLDEKQPG